MTLGKCHMTSDAANSATKCIYNKFILTYNLMSYFTLVLIKYKDSLQCQSYSHVYLIIYLYKKIIYFKLMVIVSASSRS